MSATVTEKSDKARAYDNKKTAQLLANALTRLPDEWVICRDMRHAWNVLNDFHVSETNGTRINEIRRELVCLRCQTVRLEVYVHTKFGLDKLSQSYRYPDEYQMKGVPRGVKPASIIHQEMYRRSMERLAAAARQ